MRALGDGCHSRPQARKWNEVFTQRLGRPGAELGAPNEQTGTRKILVAGEANSVRYSSTRCLTCHRRNSVRLAGERLHRANVHRESVTGTARISAAKRKRRPVSALQRRHGRVVSVFLRCGTQMLLIPLISSTTFRSWDAASSATARS